MTVVASNSPGLGFAGGAATGPVAAGATGGPPPGRPGTGPHDVGALVTAAKAGDQDAWDQLVDLFAPLVWAMAWRHGLDVADAADVSRATWLRLITNLHCIEQPDLIGHWLARTARRESRRIIRLGWRRSPGATASAAPSAAEAVVPRPAS